MFMQYFKNEFQLLRMNYIYSYFFSKLLRDEFSSIIKLAPLDKLKYKHIVTYPPICMNTSHVVEYCYLLRIILYTYFL